MLPLVHIIIAKINGWSQHKKKVKPIDHRYNKPTHLKAIDKDRSASGGKDGDQLSKSNVKCFRCKQIGHYRNQCPNASNSKEMDRKQTNAFSAVFLSGFYSKSDWYVDSGASVHMTTNEHWIINPSYEQCMKEIVVANENKVPVKCSGNVQIITCTDKCNYDVTLLEVSESTYKKWQ